MSLPDRIHLTEARVAVVGLGYVGLPLAAHIADAGFDVIAFDRDPDRVAEIKEGRGNLTDVPDIQISEYVNAGRIGVTGDPQDISGSDVFLICVPTPLKDELPDVSHVEEAGRTICRQMEAGCLVILESTTYPGTTEDLLRSILEAGGLKAGRDFHLGFSPERIDPGNTEFSLAQIPKVIGGIDRTSTDLMEAFYGTFIHKVVTVSSARAAEMTKLLENTYRHINIALANEMAILAHDLDIDIWEVIAAAATKPFGFQAFYPGPGWGGHCIPVDPTYLSWRVRQMGETARFVELAREINKRMPAYVVARVVECLNEAGKSLKGSRIFVLGVAYKADVGDLRESPALDILDRLHKAGAEVAFNDPYVDELELRATKMVSTELSERILAEQDLVLVVTDHSSYDWDTVVQAANRVLDTRNVIPGNDEKVTKL